MEEGNLLLDASTQPYYSPEHWMLPLTATAHVHLYFIRSSLFLLFFTPRVGCGWVRSWESRAAGLDSGGETSLLVAENPRWVSSSGLIFFYFFPFAIPSVWDNLICLFMVVPVRVQRGWPPNIVILWAELDGGAQEHSEASFLSSKVLTLPLRSAWEDDTCLGR